MSAPRSDRPFLLELEFEDLTAGGLVGVVFCRLLVELLELRLRLVRDLRVIVDTVMCFGMATVCPSEGPESAGAQTGRSTVVVAVDRPAGRPCATMTEIDDRLRLPPEPASAGAARRFVTNALSASDIDVGLVSLLVSELVSNVVLHAHTPLEVAVRTRGTHLRVTVTDESPVIPAMKQIRAGRRHRTAGS